MERKLYSIEDAERLILKGNKLVITGNETALDKLPKGNWIGGTIPYFMDISHGKESRDMVFIEDQSVNAIDFAIKVYNPSNQDQIGSSGFENGYTVLIIPTNSKSHLDFSHNSLSYPNIFQNPIIGYICGMHLDELGKRTAKVYNGQTGDKFEEGLVTMNIKLPDNKIGRIEIVNIFNQDKNSDLITFPKDGFNQDKCYINGEERNFADYLSEKQHDIRFPLITNQNGAMINKSFQSIDEQKKEVNFYAPLFKNETYKLAEKIDNYGARFVNILPSEVKPTYACNCILNYLYGDFSNQQFSLTYATTFGEIGYQLLNQTLVYLVIDEV